MSYGHRGVNGADDQSKMAATFLAVANSQCGVYYYVYAKHGITWTFKLIKSELIELNAHFPALINIKREYKNAKI